MCSELEDTILREMDRVAGLSIVLVKDGALVHRAACGHADLDRGVPMSIDTTSTAKTLVASPGTRPQRAGRGGPRQRRARVGGTRLRG